MIFRNTSTILDMCHSHGYLCAKQVGQAVGLVKWLPWRVDTQLRLAECWQAGKVDDSVWHACCQLTMMWCCRYWWCTFNFANVLFTLLLVGWRVTSLFSTNTMTATAISILGLHTLIAVPRSIQPSTLRGTVKWLPAFGLSDNNTVSQKKEDTKFTVVTRQILTKFWKFFTDRLTS